MLEVYGKYPSFRCPVCHTTWGLSVTNTHAIILVGPLFMSRPLVDGVGTCEFDGEQFKLIRADGPVPARVKA